MTENYMQKLAFLRGSHTRQLEDFLQRDSQMYQQQPRNQCQCLLLVVISSTLILNMMVLQPILIMLEPVYLWMQGTGTRMMWKIILQDLMTHMVISNIRGERVLGKLTIDTKSGYWNSVWEDHDSVEVMHMVAQTKVSLLVVQLALRGL